MSTARDQSLTIQRPPFGAGSLPSDSRSFGLLERLLLDLNACRNLGPQIELTIQNLRESVGADLVFWHCEDPKEDVKVTGSRTPSPEWCASFLQKRLAEMRQVKGFVLWAGKHTDPENDEPNHASAALVKVPGLPAETWIVALNFDHDRRFSEADLKLISLAWKITLTNRFHVQTLTRYKDSLVGMVRCLSTALDARDPYTAGHSLRVARIAVQVGKKMHLENKFISDVYLAGLLHDIGKIGIRDEVLLKPGRLTPEERVHMREHVVIGERIVADIRPFTHLRVGVRHHHEHFDGSGYPDGLAREKIPLLARVVAVADACDAMMSARRYRNALTPAQIDAMFTRLSGTQWDPQAIDAFMECKKEIYPTIYHQSIGDSAHYAIEQVLQQDLDDSSTTF